MPLKTCEYNMLNIACVSPNGKPAAVEYNTKQIINGIMRFNEADIIVFPRLCISSASCGHMYRQPALINACEKAAHIIAKQVKNQYVIVGMPIMLDCDSLLDVAAIMHEGKILDLVPLENSAYPFDDFLEETLWQSITVSKKINKLPDGRTFSVGNSYNKTNIILLPSSKAYIAGDYVNIQNDMVNLSKDKIVALAQAGKAESSTYTVHAGICVVAKNGNLLGFSKPFADDAYCYVSSNNKAILAKEHEHYSNPKVPFLTGDRHQQLFDCIEIPAQGLATRMRNTGIKNSVLGLSGGLDSSMALLIMVRTLKILNLPNSSAHVYMLKGEGTSKRTLTNARELCSALDINLNELSIVEDINNHLSTIKYNKKDVVFENAQARERTQILLDISNKVGGLMVGPSDMSEIALGFTTFGGDHMSMYGVNAGIPKTLIRLAVEYKAEASDTELKNVLKNILNTPISPELMPEQQYTEEILGPYILNDFFLYHHLDEKEPLDILSLANTAFCYEYDKKYISTMLNTFYKRFFAAQFKRNCIPDSPKVFKFSLSPMYSYIAPSDMSSISWTDALKDVRNL
ncbi:MAG: NAD(+) synthase [Christensenellales bacterium]|jgi:NAD+ synthase (glutamine-hydrolysing)